MNGLVLSFINTMNNQGRRKGTKHTFDISELEVIYVVKDPTIQEREEPSRVSRNPLLLYPPCGHGSVTVSMPEVN